MESIQESVDSAETKKKLDEMADFYAAYHTTPMQGVIDKLDKNSDR